MEPTARDLQKVWDLAFDTTKDCEHAPESPGKESCRSCRTLCICKAIRAARDFWQTHDSLEAPPRFSSERLLTIHLSGAKASDVRRLIEFIRDDGVRALHEGRVVVTILPEDGE
jgi:hypothetical protein